MEIINDFWLIWITIGFSLIAVRMVNDCDLQVIPTIIKSLNIIRLDIILN